ncbi:radical SAM protein [Bacillus paranthracis]
MHGGEPLIIGMEKMLEILNVLKTHDEKVNINIQTNGTLLNKQWIEFFIKEWPEISIGISLDGDMKANSFRIDYQENFITDKVEKTLKLLEDYEIEIGIIGVVTRNSLGRSQELLDYYSQFKSIKFIRFVPCLDYNVTADNNKFNKKIKELNPTNQGIPAWATTPLEYANFVNDLYDTWKTKGYYNNFLLEPIQSVINKYYGNHTKLCHFTEMKCSYVLTLYPDGRIGSCDELSMPESVVGHINTVENIHDLLHMQSNKLLRNDLNKVLEKCNTCTYKNQCGGGCLATRVRYQDTPFYEEYCQHRIQIIDYIYEDLLTVTN